MAVPAEAARRRKIRFINPNSPLSNITMPALIRNMTFTRKAIFAPTGLTICAAVMPPDWTVELVDECTLEQPHRAKADTDIVGISAMTTQARRAYEIAEEYRRLGVTVVMGGIHPSALPHEALQHCDSVCLGDAESTLPHLIADWEAAVQRGHDPRDGLADTYDWASFPTAPIATPRKDLFEPCEYLVANPIQTTRGCPHTCNFCTTPGVFGRKFRQRAVADIVEEIRAAKERQRSWCYIFADDNFGGNHKWALELCAALKPLKIAWATQCDVLISNTDKLLRAMRESGCVGLILGLESLKQSTLSEAGKKFVKSVTYRDRIRKIQSYRISLWGAFILGFDSDTWQDCMETCRFAQRSSLAMSCYPILTPYPGTAFYDEFSRSGRLRTRDWERYNGASIVFEPRNMSAQQLRHAQMAAFAEFFTLRSTLRRLRLLPFKSRAWLANVAIWKGIRYFYGRRGRPVPAFRDFLDPGSHAWDYAREDGEQAAAANGITSGRAGDDHRLETVAAGAVCGTDPITQAAQTLRMLEASTRQW
ncbi:MAG: B12-binding domain-containing radical SAM protein [Planctomycetes bacterium]|nr:B12-binding domain-containing radical SAM protein [Planctomycetota bacterium]